AIAAFLNIFSLRVSRFGILSGCLEVSSPSSGCVSFLNSKPRRFRGFLCLSVDRSPRRSAVMALGGPLRRGGACPLRHLQETIPYLPPKQPAALRPRLL